MPSTALAPLAAMARADQHLGQFRNTEGVSADILRDCGSPDRHADLGVLLPGAIISRTFARKPPNSSGLLDSRPAILPRGTHGD